MFTNAFCIFLVLIPSGSNFAQPKTLPQRIHRKTYSKEGQASLTNCANEIKVAEQYPIPLNFELVVLPFWTNNDEFKEDPDVLQKYNWAYRMVKEIESNGKKIEQSINIEKFEDKKRGSLTFPAYSLTPGLYMIYPNVSRKSLKDNLEPFLIKVCYLRYTGVAPIAVITGGTYRLVPSNTEIGLSGSESIDLNQRSKDSTTLKYQWTCSQKRTPPTFCKTSPISTQESFTIPSKFITAGDKFEVVLNVRTVFNNSAETRQDIEIISDGVLLEMRCKKNCPPVSEWSNINSVTFVSVVCLKNCDHVKEDSFIWSISTKPEQASFKFHYIEDTEFGNRGQKFIINKDVLKPMEYSVKVSLQDGKNRKGEAVMTLTFQSPPEVTACRTVPASGDSLQTYFLIECNQKPSPILHFYELYCTQKGEDFSESQVLMDGFYPAVYKRLFLLPSSDGHTFVVKISIENGPFTLVPIQPNVKFLKKSFKEIKKLYLNQIPNLIDNTRPQKREDAIQTFQTLIDELRFMKNDEEIFQGFVEDFKFQVVEDLLKLPLVTSREVMKMGDAVEKLMAYKDQNKSEPLLFKYSSALCKKLGQKYVDVLQKERFPFSHEDINSKLARSVLKCMEANTNPKFEILEPFPFNITTVVPSVTESVLVENYPDYQEFSDEYYKNIESLQEATNNVLEGASAAAKVISLSTAVGQKPVRTKEKSTEILVAKDRGDNLATTKLQTNGVDLIPPQDLSETTHPVEIFMLTWTKNLFWWTPNSTKPSTNIVNVEFWLPKERLSKFNKSAEIFLNVTRRNDGKAVTDEIHVPEGYSEIFHQKLSRHIYVRRVNLPSRSTLLVKFSNLSTTALNVVVTLFKFPTIEDFAPPETIDETKQNLVSATNFHSYDVWGYVGILPKREIVKTESTNSIKFEAIFFASFCMRWKPYKNEWQLACEPGGQTNLTLIHCLCSEFSTIAGYNQNIKSIHQEVNQEEMVILLRATPIVFIVLGVIVALYCFLLPLTLCKKEKKAMLYFLADNLAKHRYAYLVLIVTDKIGTTSHVTIKINGTKNSTPAHVLNYPDPKKRLLQKKCKDVFVITSNNHLGNIQNIELWVDCFGTKPSWSCNKIEIYDLQWKQAWYFGINRLLSTQSGNIYLTLYPTKREPKNPVKTVLKKVSIWNNLHTWCFWAHEMNFSYVKRLTVVLSTILMTFAMVLIIEGVPEMELRDIFDLNGFTFGRYDVFAGVLGSLVAFITHILLAWSFRVSTLQFSNVSNDSELPYSVTKGCWRLLTILIIASTCFLIVAGFWLPYNRSWVWLTACGIGIIFDIFVYENIVIMIFSFFQEHEKIEHFGKHLDTVLGIIEKQRRFLLQHFGNTLLRPQVEHLHKPLENAQFKERKMKDNLRKNFSEEIVDLVMFTVYILLLYIVILVNKDSSAVFSKKELENMFNGKHTRTLDFTSVKSTDGMYRYINETLIPVLQPQYWYEGVPISEPGVMVDFANKYLGIVRFRQQRVKSNACTINQLMKFLNVTKCWPELTISNTETKHFGYKWGNFSSILMLDRLRSIWNYLGETETKTLTSFGEFGLYSGGGYLSYLGRNIRNSLVNFRQLVRRIWVDERTRSFFIEFLTYNTNNNVFNAVRLLFEKSATGYVSNTILIYPARMIFIENEIEQMAMVFFALFVLWVIILFFKRSVGVIKNITSFYKNFWLMVDIIIIITSLICIIVYFVRLKLVRSYLDTLENVKHNQFIHYFALFYIEEFLSLAAAFLVLISTARLWKFLRFGLFFRIMETTLSRGAFPLLSLTFAFFVILMAFGLSGVLIFGDEFPELSSLIKIVATLITLSLKPDQFEITKYTEFTIAYCYFSSYLLLMQVIIFVYIIIIIMSYIKARFDFSGETPTYNFSNFFKEKTHYILKLFRRKRDHLSGGEDRKKVNPKSNEFHYANCLYTERSTMRIMASITKGVIKHMEKEDRNEDLSADDIQLMLEVCRGIIYGVHEDDKIEIFFKGHFVGERIQVIDENRIMRVAYVVELLLQDKKQVLKPKETIKNNQDTLKRCDFMLKHIYGKVRNLSLEEIGKS